MSDGKKYEIATMSVGEEREWREIAPLKKRRELLPGEVEGPYLYPSPSLREIMEGVEPERTVRIVECGAIIWQGTVADALAMCR